MIYVYYIGLIEVTCFLPCLAHGCQFSFFVLFQSADSSDKGCL